MKQNLHFLILLAGCLNCLAFGEPTKHYRLHVKNRTMLQLPETPMFPFTTAPTNKTIRLLFIGNSYTYVNDVPAKIRTFATARGRDFYSESVTPGGQFLVFHLDDSAVLNRLNNQKWDYVVLQDQSDEPSSVQPRTEAAVTRFKPLLDKAEAQGILYVTPAHFIEQGYQNPDGENGWDFVQRLNNNTYLRAGKANRMMSAPAGPAFQTHYDLSYDRTLHSTDNSHFSQAGSWIAAATIYCTITGESAVGLPNHGASFDQPLLRYYQEIVDTTMKTWRQKLVTVTDDEIAPPKSPFN